MIVCLLSLVATAACGGGDKKPTTPKVVKKDTPPPPPPETEEDREKKRQAAAHDIVPPNSTCLPLALKEQGAPRLDLAAIGQDAVLCATDTDESRLLGMVACWKIDLASGQLEPREAAPVPGRGFKVKFDDRCVRGYCLPKDAKLPPSGIAHIVWKQDGSKVAVLAGDDVHLYDAASKARESSFSIRGDKGVSNDPSTLAWVGDTILVEGVDAGPFSAVWVFKSDGTQVGSIEPIGGKPGTPVSTYGGSFVILDKERVGVAERGYTTMTTYEVATGKRGKLVRKVGKPTCKPAELEAYWMDQDDQVGEKCKKFMAQNFEHLVGADAVAGSKNLLVLLRGPRLGELAVLDAKLLVEKKSIPLPWCESGGGNGATAEGSASE